MKEIVIEKGVPLPAIQSYSKLPFTNMEIGDSFAIKIPKQKDIRTFVNAARCNAYMWGKRHGVKFTSRVDMKKEEFRIWRIA